VDGVGIRRVVAECDVVRDGGGEHVRRLEDEAACRRRSPYRRRRESVRSKRIMPDVGSTRPASRRSSVDFPEPERPTIATVVPGATSRLIPVRMGSLASGG
jgi:hypothetical protein